VSHIILDSEFSPTEWREYVAPHNDFPLTPIPLDTDNIEGDSRESAVRFTTQKLQRILQSFLTEDDYPDWVMNEVERHMRGMDRFDDSRTWVRATYLENNLKVGRKHLTYLHAAKGNVDPEWSHWLAVRTEVWRHWYVGVLGEVRRHERRHFALVQGARQLRNQVIMSLIKDGKRRLFLRKLDILSSTSKRRPLRKT
jgi:hypothetical protein